jgi:hypothetical protein
MYYAVKQLWDLYRQSDNDKYKLIQKYQERFDKEEIEEETANNKIEYIKTTIHHSRRIVVLYYMNIAKILHNKLFSERYFFSLWNPEDLDIIKKIVLPIQYKLIYDYNNKETDEVTDLLNELCIKSEKYHKKLIKQFDTTK